MQEIHCDECEKKNCEQRLKGAVCSLNKETKGLIKMFESRDPFLIARKFIELLDSEMERYGKAKTAERVGEVDSISYVTKKGEVKVRDVERGLDNRVTFLAANILKGAKLMSDIVNPAKPNPMFQQNNQYNLTIGAVNAINGLPEAEREGMLKFIDDKLDDARQNQGALGAGNA